MANPEFTVTFIIDNKWQRYSDFIHTLRGRVADPNAPPCRGLPQLPPEDPNLARSRGRWFALVLQAGINKLTLRIRRENLYIDAYQMMGGRWAEYKSPHRLYPNSVRLDHIDGSYPQLENRLVQRENIGLTLQTLTDAVNELAHIVCESTESRRSQLVLLQMISESLRFESITRYLVAGHALRGAPSWMIGREGSWAKLSVVLLAVVADRFQPFDFTQQFKEKAQIWSVPDVINALGIVKPAPRGGR